MQVPSVAVVIPTLNEEAALPSALASLSSQTAGHRVVIADGGSTDGTSAVAMMFGARFLEVAQKGRGCQIAAAMGDLEEDVVLVLHADMILPPTAIERIQLWLSEHPTCPGGCLGHRFDNTRTIYRIIEKWDSMRARWGTSFGDQAQFFRRELLERCGGFPNQLIMEDLELSRRLKALGQPAYLDCEVRVSPRHIERRGWFRSALTNCILRWSYRLHGPGICCKLYQRYYG